MNKINLPKQHPKMQKSLTAHKEFTAYELLLHFLVSNNLKLINTLWPISVGRKLVQPQPLTWKDCQICHGLDQNYPCWNFCSLPVILSLCTESMKNLGLSILPHGRQLRQHADIPFFSFTWRCSFHLFLGCCLHICGLAHSVAQEGCSRCWTHISPCLIRFLSAHSYRLWKILWLQPCVTWSTSCAILCQ